MHMYFSNSDGLVSSPFWCGVVSEQTLKKLKKGDPTGKEKRAIELVASLPLIGAEQIKDTRKAPNASGLLHAMPLVGKFYPKFDHNTLLVTQEQWEAGQPTHEMIDAIKIVAAMSEEVLLPRTVKSLLKALETGEITAEEFSKIENFASSESFALFCCLGTGEEGYLDKNGRLGLLGQAQTYASKAEMEAAIKRYSLFDDYDKVQVVHLNVNVSHVGGFEYPPNGGGSWRMLDTDFSQSSLPEVQAYVQKKMIDNALRQMSDEQIQEILANRTKKSKKKM